MFATAEKVFMSPITQINYFIINYRDQINNEITKKKKLSEIWSTHQDSFRTQNTNFKTWILICDFQIQIPDLFLYLLFISMATNTKHNHNTRGR